RFVCDPVLVASATLPGDRLDLPPRLLPGRTLHATLRRLRRSHDRPPNHLQLSGSGCRQPYAPSSRRSGEGLLGRRPAPGNRLSCVRGPLFAAAFTGAGSRGAEGFTDLLAGAVDTFAVGPHFARIESAPRRMQMGKE